MGKKQLQKFIDELSREELEAQLLDLYTRFKEVKTFYDFSFNPKEDQLLEDARFKIGKEYFPQNGRKAKMRPSVAQKLIRHYKKLEVNPEIVADIMLYNIEIAQTYYAEKPIVRRAFFKSMQNSFEEAVEYISDQGYESSFVDRIQQIIESFHQQEWPNAKLMSKLAQRTFSTN